MREHMKIIEDLKASGADAFVAAVRDHIDRSMGVALGFATRRMGPIAGGAPAAQEI